MPIADRQAHWENVYRTKTENEVSWFEENPATSLALIHATGVPKDAAIIDIGGGASRLVDALLHESYSAVTVLDISQRALTTAKARLGNRASSVSGGFSFSDGARRSERVYRAGVADAALGGSSDYRYLRA